MTVDELADLFAADVSNGIDANDYSGPVVHRTEHRAGVIKIAGSDGGPSDRDRRVFEAAAEAHRRTGVPILTHCENGTGALEQLRLLADQGVDLGHVALSHVDKVVDRAYHRELLSSGAFAEYDQSFRWGDQPNGTIRLLEWMIEDGLDGRIVVGMDAAKRGYYRVFGGQPGLAWLLDGFRRLLDGAGIGEAVRHRLFVTNPAQLYCVQRAEWRCPRMTDGIRTSVVGSHARPSWFVAGIEAAERGDFGPADLAEMLDDAVDVALRDQEEAGIDIVTDGEMRRAGFFTAEFYRHVSGLRPLPAERRLGAGGHDQQHRFEVLEPISAPDGLGVVAEYRAAAARARRPLKVTLPGPYTLSGRLRTGPGEVYAHRNDAAEAFVPILRTELADLVAAGAGFIQIDEPSPAIHPDAPADFSALFNAAVEPIVGRARIGAHLCFGNFLGRPLARRTYRPVLDAMLGVPGRRARARVRQPRDGRGRDPRRHRRGGARRRGRHRRREELLPRDGRRRRRADRRRPGGGRPGGSPDGRPRLRASARPRAGPRRRSSGHWSPAGISWLGRSREEEHP